MNYNALDGGCFWSQGPTEGGFAMTSEFYKGSEKFEETSLGEGAQLIRGRWRDIHLMSQGVNVLINHGSNTVKRDSEEKFKVISFFNNDEKKLLKSIINC